MKMHILFNTQLTLIRLSIKRLDIFQCFHFYIDRMLFWWNRDVQLFFTIQWIRPFILAQLIKKGRDIDTEALLNNWNVQQSHKIAENLHKNYTKKKKNVKSAWIFTTKRIWGYVETHTKTDWHSEFDSELESSRPLAFVPISQFALKDK